MAAISPPVFHTPAALYSIAGVFTVLPCLFVALRLWGRRRIRALLLWDDWLIIGALVACIALAVTIVIDTKYGGLGQHIAKDADGHVIRDRIFWTHLKANTAIRLLQVPTFGFTKLSVLFFYRRLFDHVNTRFDYSSKALIAIVTCWLIGFFVVNFFECSNAVYLVQAYIDVGTDIAILALPVPLIVMLRLSTRKKWGVIGIFGLGGVTVIVSAWRAAIQHVTVEEYHEGKGDADVTYILTPSIYSSVIEGALGIIGACLPLLRPLFRPTQLREMVHIRWFHSQTRPEVKASSQQGMHSANFCKSEDDNLGDVDQVIKPKDIEAGVTVWPMKYVHFV